MYLGIILKSTGKVANVYVLLLSFIHFLTKEFFVFFTGTIVLNIADVYAVTVKFYISESLHAV